MLLKAAMRTARRGTSGWKTHAGLLKHIGAK
jgi:hypothetical protein